MYIDYDPQHPAVIEHGKIRPETRFPGPAELFLSLQVYFSASFAYTSVVQVTVWPLPLFITYVACSPGKWEVLREFAPLWIGYNTSDVPNFGHVCLTKQLHFLSRLLMLAEKFCFFQSGQS